MYSCSTETVSLAKRLHGLLADEHHYEDDVEVARKADTIMSQADKVRAQCRIAISSVLALLKLTFFTGW